MLIQEMIKGVLSVHICIPYPPLISFSACKSKKTVHTFDPKLCHSLKKKYVETGQQRVQKFIENGTFIIF